MSPKYKRIERNDRLFHGTQERFFNKILRGKKLMHEYDYFDATEWGIYLTNDPVKPRIHGGFIIEVELPYSLHKHLVEVCNKNANGELLDDFYLFHDYLDIDEPECYYDGFLDSTNIINAWRPEDYKWSEDGSLMLYGEGCNLPWM